MDVKIEYFEFLTTGINICYLVDGKVQTIMADAIQAADLLKKYKFIEDYSGKGDQLCVLIENPYKRYSTDEPTVWVNYKNYIITLGHTFDERDAHNIAYAVETEKASDKIRKQLQRA